MRLQLRLQAQRTHGIRIPDFTERLRHVVQVLQILRCHNSRSSHLDPTVEGRPGRTVDRPDFLPIYAWIQTTQLQFDFKPSVALEHLVGIVRIGQLLVAAAIQRIIMAVMIQIDLNCIF